MIVPLADIRSDTRFDIVAIGGGVAGMAAALFGAIEGKRVLLVERTELLGGTSALSAGTTWVPNTAPAGPWAQDDSFESAKRFLDEAVGNHAPAALREAFLRSAPSAIATLEANSEVRFRPFAMHPDYEQQLDGATLRGRALEPIPFDGRLLGESLDCIRRPIPEMTILGGMMVDRTDVDHFLNAKRSLRSFAHAVRLLGIYGRDRLTRRRATRLVMGSALIGRFLASLEQRGVPIVLVTSATSFIGNEREVSGLVLRSGAVERRVFANAAVVLASGGFGRHQRRRTEMLHHPVPELSPTAPGHTGEMQDLALALGARFGSSNLDHAFWAPVSVRTRPDGSTAVFPHFVMDRSKPGTVCVNQSGERFTNESASYHRFARAMFEANKTSPCIPSFILADSRTLRKYGLGMIRMNARDLSPFISDGYLVEAASIPELAAKLGMQGDALVHTVAKMNEYAATGIDPDFGRGTTAYHRINGDPTNRHNPTLAPISTPPFYAVRLYPADIGCATGLVTDEWARVLRFDDMPITGLYACGNEANSVMGGVYPGPGITIGPAIVFAWRAIQDATGSPCLEQRQLSSQS